MRSSQPEADPRAKDGARPRIEIFLMLVFMLSWPFLIYGFGWFASAGDVLKRYAFSCMGMLMVALSAFVTRACFERQGFRDVGWSLGHGKWYLAVFLFCALLWLGPPLAALPLGGLELNHNKSRDELVAVILSLSGLSLVAGFGEEFGWRGYLLPRLLSGRRIAREILVIVGLVWGVWHCAVAVGPLVRAVLDSTCVWPSTVGAALLGCVRTVGASIALSFIFGAVWLKSESVFLSSFLHGCWLGVRDARSHLFNYPSRLDLVTVIIVLAAWFIAYRWLRRYERGEVL
jgi:membrane protease YdiL (CAAX protease family)